MVCRGCDAETENPVFCNNQCQQAKRQRDLIDRWLSTGIAISASHQKHYVRNYIAEQQKHRCAVCAVETTWNGLPLLLVLDHVSGDSTDNRRENLRLVCPNCDSQLPTFKARNMGNGRHSRRVRYAEGKSF